MAKAPQIPSPLGERARVRGESGFYLKTLLLMIILGIRASQSAESAGMMDQFALSKHAPHYIMLQFMPRKQGRRVASEVMVTTFIPWTH